MSLRPENKNLVWMNTAPSPKRIKLQTNAERLQIQV